MVEFKIGDWVRTKENPVDRQRHGKIVDIQDGLAFVAYDTITGKHMLVHSINDLEGALGYLGEALDD